MRRRVDSALGFVGGVAMVVGVLASNLVLFAAGCGALIVATLPWPPLAR